VLDAFKCNLTLEVKFVIHTMNTNLAVVPGWTSSQLQVLDVYGGITSYTRVTF
jgi:hypothetical protein